MKRGVLAVLVVLLLAGAASAMNINLSVTFVGDGKMLDTITAGDIVNIYTGVLGDGMTLDYQTVLSDDGCSKTVDFEADEVLFESSEMIDGVRTIVHLNGTGVDAYYEVGYASTFAYRNLTAEMDEIAPSNYPPVYIGEVVGNNAHEFKVNATATGVNIQLNSTLRGDEATVANYDLAFTVPAQDDEIVFDGELYNAYTINDIINDRTVITGQFESLEFDFELVDVPIWFGE